MMKQTKAVLFTAILMLVAFGSVVYTSCRKDRCKSLVCQNGGACSDGFCLCPYGYTGTYCEVANVSAIGFRNQTFTTVTLTINGIDYSVDSGKTITFTGSNGDTLQGIGKTHGIYGINVELPYFRIVFPSTGTLTHDLDVPSDYFFLMATNNNPTVPYITQVHVYQTEAADSTLDITSIYNDGRTYHIGYYHSSLNSRVRLEKTPNFWNFSNFLATPMTKNQFFNAVAN